MDDDFGTTLATFRRRARLNQELLAADVNVSRGTISDWERGLRVPGQRELERLAEVLCRGGEERAAFFAAAYRSHDSYTRYDFFAHSRRPLHYIERTEVIANLRIVLASDGAQTHRRPVALHGMSGIGKTVLARALCDDSDVQNAFPNGILWATLGPSPDLRTILREWVYALGGMIREDMPSINSLVNTVATLLKEQACLLILDDVLRHTDARTLDVGGSRCRLLITTRDAAIASELGAEIQPIPPMTHPESITLLEDWASGQLQSATQIIKENIVLRLGRLPLALKLAGAQLQEEAPEEWLQAFEVRALQSRRPENLHDSLEWTFNRSLTALDPSIRRQYVALAIFRSNEPVPETGIQRLWQGLVETDARTTMRQINDLAARALLEVSSDGVSRTVELHPLLHDFIHAELGSESHSTHQALLKTYRTLRSGSGWHTISDDGYLYDHLAYHLDGADEAEELRLLFTDQEWLRVRFAQRGYTYDGYIDDLNIAWARSDTEARRQIEAPCEPTAFADCVRYALIRTSINSIAGTYIPELVAPAVAAGFWTTERALSIVAKDPDPSRRSRMYGALLRTGQLNETQRTRAQALGAVSAQEAFSSGRNLKEMLPELLPVLTAEQQNDVLVNGLETARSLRDWQRRDILLALAPWLSDALIDPAFEIAFEIEDKFSCAQTLEAIAPRLSPELLQRGLQIAEMIEDERGRAAVLAALAPYLTGGLIERAFQATLDLQDARWQGETLAGLVQHLEGQLLQRSVQLILELPPVPGEVEALVALVPRLAGEQQARVLQRGFHAAVAVATQIGNVRYLVELLPYLPAEQGSKALLDVFATALFWPSSVDLGMGRERQLMAGVLAALAPHLPDHLLEQGLDAVLALEDEELQSEALAALADALNDKLLDRALPVALSLAEEKGYAKAFIALAPKLTGVWLQGGLTVALAIAETRARIGALSALIPHLSVEDQHKALRSSLEPCLVEDGFAQVHALATLTSQLTGAPRTYALKHALEISLAYTHELQQAPLIKELAPQLSSPLLETALDAVLLFEGDLARIEALKALAPQLVDEPLERALEAALAISDTQGRAKTLAALLAQLPGEAQNYAFQEGWKAAHLIDDEGARIRALVAFVPYLSIEQRYKVLKQSLDLALAMEFEHQRARTLIALAPYIGGVMLEHSIEATRAIRQELERANVLAALAPQLSDDQLPVGLEIARTIMDENARAIALAALAPKFTDPFLEPWFDAVGALQDEQQQAVVLAALAPRLKGRLRDRGLDSALKLTNGIARAQTLVAFLPECKEPALLLQSIRQVLVDELKATKDLLREDMLGVFSAQELYVSPVLTAATMSAIISHIVEICQEWHWL